MLANKMMMMMMMMMMNSRFVRCAV